MIRPSREDGFAYELPQAENISRISDVIHSSVADTLDGVLIAGIYPGVQFPLTVNPTDTTQFTIGVGHALDINGNSIRIEDATVLYPNLNPATGHTTEEGPNWVDDQLPAVATPQSTGSKYIPRVAASDTYITIKYLSTVDLTDEVHSVLGMPHGYSAKADGYVVEVSSSVSVVAANIADGAIFLGVIPVDGSVAFSGGGFQRQILRTGISEVQTGEFHSHTGYTLSLLAKFSGVATAKVRITVAGTSPAEYVDYPITGTINEWAEHLIDLQEYSGKSITIALGSCGASYVSWDAVRVCRSRNTKDDSADIYPINYSFEQFTFRGDGTADPELDATINGWDTVSLDAGGTLKGWSYITQDSTSGEAGSLFVVNTVSYHDTLTVYGAVETSTAVIIPETFQLNGEFSILDRSIPSSKMAVWDDYVKTSGDTMTGALAVQADISSTGTIHADTSVTSTGAITGGSAALTGSIAGASLAVTGAVTGATVTTTGAITADSLVVTGYTDGVKVATHNHSGSGGNGVLIPFANVSGVAVTFAQLVAAVQTSLCPVGMITGFPTQSATPPLGWLFCDGAPIPGGTEYQALRDMLTPLGLGTTPLMTDGRFLKGVIGTSAGVSAEDSLQGHYHLVVDSGHTHTMPMMYSGTGAYDVQTNFVKDNTGPNAYYHTANSVTGVGVTGASSDGTNGTPRVGLTTQPKSFGVRFCIKY